VVVSAAGFTKGAKNAAATFNIPLRTLQQVDLPDVLLWFPFKEIALHKLCWELHYIDIAVDKATPESLQSLVSSIENEVPPVDKVLFRAKHNGSLALIWQHLWNDLPGPRIYEGVPSDGTRIRRIVQIQFPDEQQRYQIESTVGFVVRYGGYDLCGNSGLKESRYR
jgi:hypothetical protein